MSVRRAGGARVRHRGRSPAGPARRRRIRCLVPEFHAEPYLQLAGLSHKSALISWGAFYFKTRSTREWKLVDDSDLRYVHPPRRESIGARSAPYGPARPDGRRVRAARSHRARDCSPRDPLSVPFYGTGRGADDQFGGEDQRRLDLLAGLPLEHDRARVNFAYGQTLRRAGRRRDSELIIGTARQLFATLGATTYAARW